jgi:hypothetical protein
MSATDVRPTRVARAQDLVHALIGGLGPGDTMTLVDAGTAPHVLASSGDHAVLLRALARLAPGDGPSSLAGDIPLLSGRRAAGGPRTQPYLFAPLGTSGATLGLLRRALPGLQVRLVGTDDADRAVAGLVASCPAPPSGQPCESSARLVNTGAQAFTTRVTALVDGVPSAQQVTLPARSTTTIALDLPAGARSVEVRLDGHDALPADDAAWAVVPLPVRRTVLLVTAAADSPLAQALRAIPNLTLKILPPGDPAVRDRARHADLTVVDGADPDGLPGNLLVVNPPQGTELVGKEDTVGGVGVTAQDTQSPLLRGVDLSSLVIGTAARVRPPPWAHVDVQGTAGPLLFDGVTGGRRVAVLPLDPQMRTSAQGSRESITGSNLSTLLAFPILLQNAVGALVPDAPAGAVAGQVAAEPTMGRGAVWLRRSPDGRAVALPVAGHLVALPALRPGLYTLGGDEDAAGTLAVNAPVPGDPLAAEDTGGASAPAPAAPTLATPARIAPWALWTPVILLALLVVSGEWWYYVRRT